MTFLYVAIILILLVIVFITQNKIKAANLEIDLLKRQEKALYRHTILIDLFTRNFKNKQEQLDYVLEKALELTESQYGYIYFYDEAKKEFTLNSWTSEVMKECEVAEKLGVYQLNNTGIWGEVVRQRKPIILNDFEHPHELKKGYPQGHVALKKYMSVPVIIDGSIVAVVGLVNKIGDYNENDVYEMTLLMTGVWNAVERREAQERLTFERNKYLQTIISIGDGVMVVDKEGTIEMLNHMGQKLTGLTMEEAVGKAYKEVFLLSAEREIFGMDDPIARALETDSIQVFGACHILISKEGAKYYVEDIAAPVKDDKGNTVGVVLVFRNVTEKNEQIKKIEYLSFHDSLTGLYNRRFFEEEMSRLDTDRNLPISLIMGDINGLKLINDIFGHSFGDVLLDKAAEVMKRVCRAEDIIARWGGDEFVFLLPKTKLAEAEQIIERIKTGFAKENVKAIKGSISMGAYTKQHNKESLSAILDIAEEKMYTAKTMERDEVGNNTINMIVQNLHENSPREKEHAQRVSELCQRIGKKLQLSDVEIRELKDAGYYHDIGKIALEPKLLRKRYSSTDQEWNEIRKHPIIGYRILNFFDSTLDLAEVVLAHQEYWDGSGYPKGLRGEEIPLPARIIALAESYERMVSETGDYQPISKGAAIVNLRGSAGKHFDPALTEIFIYMLEEAE